MIADTVRNARSTLADAKQSAAKRLRLAGIESADLDARVLVAHAAGIGSGAPAAELSRGIDRELALRLEQAVRRRIAGEPVARIVGWREFWSLRFVLGPDTLVPRPETETLVEAVLAARSDGDAALHVLDLGTGTGALLAAILHERPRAFGVGVDRSVDALKTARTNLNRLGLGARARFVCADWGAALAGSFDVVVSNPPYIGSGEWNDLPTEVRNHDPRLALDGGSDGLDAYRAIGRDLKRLLAPSGIAVLELGAGREDAVVTIVRAAGLTVNGPARRDLAGHARALVVTV